MENHSKSPKKLSGVYALEIYVLVTTILVLIILYSSFQYSDGGILTDEIYLHNNTVELSGS